MLDLVVLVKDARHEDPEWFDQVRMPKAKSKKAVLRDNAKRRVKGYYYKVSLIAEEPIGFFSTQVQSIGTVIKISDVVIVPDKP